MNKTVFFLPIKDINDLIVIHISKDFSVSDYEKSQIFSMDYTPFRAVLLSLKEKKTLSSETLELILELRRKLKNEESSLFLVEIQEEVFSELSKIGIPSIECFETLQEAVFSV